MPDTTVLPLNEEIQHVAAQAMQLALQHIDAGQYDEAATLCRAVLEMHPGHAQAEYQLGLLEWQAQHLPEAAAHLSRALQADPGEGAYWLAYIEVLLDAAELPAAKPSTWAAATDCAARRSTDWPSAWRGPSAASPRARTSTP